MLGTTAYVFSGNQYLRFSNGLDLADADSPKPLAGNGDSLPEWPHVSAAFTGLDGRTYFFNNQTQQFITLENGHPSSPRAVVQQWGRMRGDSANVIAAFSLGDSTYLAYGSQY